MMRPKPWAYMPGSTAWVRRNVPRRCTLITRSHVATGISSTRSPWPMPGIVDENVDPPGRLQRGGDKARCLAFIGNIGLHRQRLGAKAADLGRHSIGRCRFGLSRVVDDDNGRPGAGEGQRRRLRRYRTNCRKSGRCACGAAMRLSCLSWLAAPFRLSDEDVGPAEVDVDFLELSIADAPEIGVEQPRDAAVLRRQHRFKASGDAAVLFRPPCR